MATEDSPLLPSLSPEDADASLAAPVKTFHTAYYILPAALLTRLAATLPSTTLLEVVLQIVCRLYWNGQDPDSVPDDEAMARGRCSDPNVQQIFTLVVTIFTIVEGIGAFFMFRVIGDLSARFGRKPILLLLVFLSILGTACIPLSTFVSGKWQGIVLVVWPLLAATCGLRQYGLINNMYAVDSSSSEERTAVLSHVLGWTVVGGIPSFAFGGLITTWTGDELTVFYLSMAISAVAFIYIAVVLPESFGADKRAELRREQEVESRGSRRADQRAGIVSRVNSKVSAFFRPLAPMWPKRNPDTGRYNLRILACGLHDLLSNIGQGYIDTGTLIYLTTFRGYKPDDNGLFLSVYSLAAVLSLTVLTPLVVKWGRPRFMYQRVSPDPSVAASDETGAVEENKIVGTQFDVYFSIIGWIVEIVAVVLLAYARTHEEVLAISVFHGLSAGRLPAFRSVVAASVEPLRSGEVMSAVDMVGSVGVALSGVVLGSVLSATISTIPPLMFWVYAGICGVAMSLLFLIRDADGFHPPI